MDWVGLWSKQLEWYRKVYKGVVYGGLWSNLGTIGYQNRGLWLNAKTNPVPLFIVSRYGITNCVCVYYKSIYTLTHSGRI